MDWSRLRPDEQPFYQPNGLKFRIYTPKEILSLSVLRVTQQKTFDELGHPLANGLYDPRFGPTDARDKCVTCGLQGGLCPGHFGHIILEVPVFNPLLFSLTYKLLQSSCVHCHRFYCNTSNPISQVFLLELKCIDEGLLHYATLIKEAILMKTESESGEDNIPDVAGIEPLRKFEKYIKKECKAMKEAGQIPNYPTKNTIALKEELVKKYLKDTFFKRRQVCPLCKNKNGTLKNDNNQLIILDFVGNTKGKKNMALNTSVTEDFDLKVNAAKSSETGAQALERQICNVRQGRCKKLAWRAAEVREHFRLLWENEKKIISKLFPIFNGLEGLVCPLDICFSEVIMVPPSIFRPSTYMKGEKYNHPETTAFKNLLEASNVISLLNLTASDRKMDSMYDASVEQIIQTLKGNTLAEKVHNAYLNLQMKYNTIYNSDSVGSDSCSNGLKQLLEKKEGLFRMHMMGKRVNYACRSVITPDPYLDVDEIGIPLVFAKKLTFAEPVNSLNAIQLRNQVRNGPNKHPGALFIQQNNKYQQRIFPTEESRQSLAKKVVPTSSEHTTQTTVYRHLQEGDMLLMNRQPSLHKPSIMGHRARILTSQKALRMNYAPCKAYNADFDGDEMNGHFIQNRVGQTEARELANVGSNFLVPKDGTPLLGLIQDHVVSGVYMTLRGRFFNKEDFMHLLLSAFGQISKKLVMPPPTMIKPEVLWSGKQLISAVIMNNIPKDVPKINLIGKAKTAINCWIVKGYKAPPFDMSESEVVFRNGELLVGVLDKAHFGATQYGLIHACYDLYGNRIATSILSCFSRLFTTHLQFHGFSLGVADILVDNEANKTRTKIIKKIRAVGEECVRKTFKLDDNASELEVKHVLASAYNNPQGDISNVKKWDYSIKQELNKLNDKICQACVPGGLIKSFPMNSLQMMIQSGAKGSMVNAVQISSGLGQIELEGQRPPLTASGRTLPSFKEFDPSPRAGGYVDQRFLTGINPQELFFHTMAGREGLIDTAVKTSRSGYLQRCIIKHLEGLKICYDLTVRDSDNSIVQFRYGEDGMDIGKSCFMNEKQYPFIKDNLESIREKFVPKNVRDKDFRVSKVQKKWKEYKNWKSINGSKKDYRSGFVEFSKHHRNIKKKHLIKMWFELSEEERDEYNQMVPKRLDTLDVAYNPTRYLGALPEKMMESIDKFTKTIDNPSEADYFKRSLFWKGMQSFADPGENVGLLAAQSIGEPSTQMTLNTFHFAGRGEMNVTLGIPRLREILMTASKNISTPMCEIKILPSATKEQLEIIRRELDRIYMKEVIKEMSVDEIITINSFKSTRTYTINISILPKKKRDKLVNHISCKKILNSIEKRFVKELAQIIYKRYKDITSDQTIRSHKLRGGNIAAGIVDDDQTSFKTKKMNQDDDTDDEEVVDEDATLSKLKKRRAEGDQDYDGEEEEIKEVGQNKEVNEINEDDDDEEDGESDDENKIKLENGDNSYIEMSEGAMNRTNAVINSHIIVTNYKFDEINNRWCQIVIELPFNSKSKFDVHALVEQYVEKFIIHQTPGIEKCVFAEQTRKGVTYNVLQTQGINLQALYNHSDVLDVNSLYSNDINVMLDNYGCEAAGQVIAREMTNVFSVYGIEVNPRHLSLTADYMTFTGAISPFNRIAMSYTPSPLQRITYETSLGFLSSSLIYSNNDTLQSPSSKLVVGQLMKSGTGSFDLVSVLQKRTKDSLLSKDIKSEAEDETDITLKEEVLNDTSNEHIRSMFEC
ncbi:DNA-directed RNA polymerase [Strongyloides ratti]|uniref:DNA-directed RNA polymerase subunit n=1 Tax=Strongyloides ratti TaxID=34506 RepID=A0A090L3D4_STRRB|nr:DNA-directed RNA polymerase [Strongyloides ratti]CEF62014.1 DNA-directed RNA polymerase [Strongyloides ratti]